MPAAQNFAEKVISEKAIEAGTQNLAAWKPTTEEKKALNKKISEAKKGQSPSNKFTKEQLNERFQQVCHLNWSKFGVLTEAAGILDVTPQQVGRLKKRWVSMGLLA